MNKNDGWYGGVRAMSRTIGHVEKSRVPPPKNKKQNVAIYNSDLSVIFADAPVIMAREEGASCQVGRAGAKEQEHGAQRFSGCAYSKVPNNRTRYALLGTRYLRTPTIQQNIT